MCWLVLLFLAESSDSAVLAAMIATFLVLLTFLLLCVWLVDNVAHLALEAPAAMVGSDGLDRLYECPGCIR